MRQASGVRRQVLGIGCQVLGIVGGILIATWLLAQGLGVPVGSGYTKNADGSLSVPTAPGGVPSGGIILIDSGSCPAGFTQDTAFSGAYVLGTVAVNSDVGTTGGSNSYAPAGTNGTVSFTPAGTNGTVSFTPAGSNASTTISVQGTKVSTGGGGTPAATSVGGVTVSTSSQNVTLPAETFTGTAGTISSETFTGTAGTVPAETFTGTAATITPAYLKVIACKAN